MRTPWLAFGAGLALVACGKSTTPPAHVEISGRSPAEGAAIAARAVCTHSAACGNVTIICSAGGTAGSSGSGAAAPATTCTATIEPVAFADCYAEANSDIAELLTCAAPTPEQIDTLEMCFDWFATHPCVTQAEADAKARLLESGTQPPPDPMPAACALLTDPPAGC